MSDGNSAPNPAARPAPNIWLRGLWMLVLTALFGLAQTLLCVATILQFLSMLFSGKPNENIAQFGAQLANWVAKTTRFQTGKSEDKPYPWSNWE